jgi:hypothetical protein
MVLSESAPQDLSDEWSCSYVSNILNCFGQFMCPALGDRSQKSPSVLEELMSIGVHGCASVHLWDRIHYGGRTSLVVLQGNVNADASRRCHSIRLKTVWQQFPFPQRKRPAHRASITEDPGEDLFSVRSDSQRLRNCHGPRTPQI